MRWGSGPVARQLGAELLTQEVDRDEPAAAPDMPEGPAIAGLGALDMGADLVDRAGGIAAGNGAVGADAGGMALQRIAEDLARGDVAALDQHAEGDACLGAFALGDGEGLVGDGSGGLKALGRGGGVG